ncbi:MAG: hypothetical protein JST00_40435 [Deltaproteobacteria bacterium]|nr:hypothetical protein [Deltaproteobacteria bacterium]
MKFSTRLVVTLSATIALTMSSAFVATSIVVESSELRQLDEALRSEAREEALEVSNAGGTALQISDRGGPAADDVGRLTKYAVVYDDDGRVLSSTPTFTKGIPLLDDVRHPTSAPFDTAYGGERLRAVLVSIPGHPDHQLLLAAPKADMEKDTEFLRRAMFVAALLSIGLTIVVTWRVVRHLTRGHEAIGRTARAVAGGDLGARTAMATGDDEVTQLAHDIDEMVARLALLVESQQRFAADAAHELRSPLTALYGELQLALRRSRSADEYRTSIEEALASAKRLKVLAEDLLALAQVGAARVPPDACVDLDDVARRAASWVRPEAERKGVEIAIDTKGLAVRGRAMDIERLLRNLLDNAVRHARDEGRVDLFAEQDGDEIVIGVLDDGPGVAPAERERVFDPFYRSDDARARAEGSGLGLAIAREITREHGGDIEVRSGPSGRGALFRARLSSWAAPASVTSAAACPPGAPARPAPACPDP